MDALQGFSLSCLLSETTNTQTAQTTVGMSALPVHLDRNNFGTDAQVYNPSRWIEGANAPDGSLISPEEMQRYWIPFSVGSRQCIGKNVAMLELVKLVGTLLLYFDVQLANTRTVEDKTRPEVPVSKSYFFARMSGPLMATVRERV
ncbi:hypothetical protein VTK73DRAFT_8222 [Phialemonium thermophilum]|uniref:Cytochrome P450 n=1 Tax=Phialemonium thermophilum TaxID=223376 RepID=A0ABR3W9G2_9PEZI